MPHDPQSFADALIDVISDAREENEDSLEKTLEASAKVLDSAELDFSRYGDVLFEVTFAGARLTTGGNVASEGKRLEFNVRGGCWNAAAAVVMAAEGKRLEFNVCGTGRLLTAASQLLVVVVEGLGGGGDVYFGGSRPAPAGLVVLVCCCCGAAAGLMLWPTAAAAATAALVTAADGCVPAVWAVVRPAASSAVGTTGCCSVGEQKPGPGAVAWQWEQAGAHLLERRRHSVRCGAHPHGHRCLCHPLAGRSPSTAGLKF